MAEMEQLVRSVSTEGLVWGACEELKHTCTRAGLHVCLSSTAKLVPVAYGIMKLQISCVVEDEKVGTDFLEETITAFEDHVSNLNSVGLLSQLVSLCRFKVWMWWPSTRYEQWIPLI